MQKSLNDSLLYSCLNKSYKDSTLTIVEINEINKMPLVWDGIPVKNIDYSQVNPIENIDSLIHNKQLPPLEVFMTQSFTSNNSLVTLFFRNNGCEIQFFYSKSGSFWHLDSTKNGFR